MNGEKINAGEEKNFREIIEGAYEERGKSTIEAVKEKEIQDAVDQCKQVTDDVASHGIVAGEEIRKRVVEEFSNNSSNEAIEPEKDEISAASQAEGDVAEVEGDVVEVEESPEEKANNIKNIQETIKNSNKKSAFSFKRLVVAGVLAVGIAAVLVGCGKADPTKEPTHMAVEQVSDSEVYTGDEVLDQFIDGSLTQYDNPGCFDNNGYYGYEAEKKDSPYDVANPETILNLMGTNSKEATAEQWGKAYEYMAYSQGQGIAFLAYADGSIKGLEGLSYEEIGAKIEGMTQDEKNDLIDNMKKEVFDNIEYEDNSVDGSIKNLYIIENEDGKKIDFQSETYEEDSDVLVMRWKRADGAIVEAQAKKKCFNGAINIKITHPDGSEETVVVDVPEKPDPTPKKDDSKTPFTREQVEEGGTGKITQREQDGAITEKPTTGNYTYDFDTNTYTYREKENSNPGKIINNGSGQIGTVPTNQSTINNADSSFKTEHISESEKAQIEADRAARAKQEAVNQASAENDQRAAEIVQNVEQNGGATQAQIEQKNEEQANAWANGDFDLGQ